MVTEENNIHQTSVPMIPDIVSLKAHCRVWKSSMSLKKNTNEEDKRKPKRKQVFWLKWRDHVKATPPLAVLCPLG